MTESKLTPKETKRVMLKALRQQVKRLDNNYHLLAEFKDSWTAKGYTLEINYVKEC